MLLDSIHSPQDLKKLPLESLPQLAAEIRSKIVEVVSEKGGHLASSLGCVELILALHYCLDAPRDKIIFDVGHQSYAHKILTGRREAFSTLRQYGGISGFQSKDESEYDCFTTGHSSSAISLAFGLVCARKLLPVQDHFRVAAVVGDGSLSGGLSFEGLNNAGHSKEDLLVVLNTNEHSISPNVGALSNYLNKIISLPIYNRFRESLEHFFSSRMPTGSRLIKFANKFEEGIKGLFVPGMFFEELGFRYFGPFDGHNAQELVHTFKKIIQVRGPKIVHVITVKGKGYPPAETEPVKFHGTGPFDIESGLPLSIASKSYTDTFSDKLLSLARLDTKIVAVSAAMPEGTGLHKFRDAFPDRFFDVGIAEAHAVTFAAGLARKGLKPVVAIYSTFLQRAYDQMVEDVALQRLPVIFALDRAGISGEDGATHQGILDIGYLHSIPEIVIMSPRDCRELEEMLSFAFNLDRPVAIRYPKSACEKISATCSKIELGRPEILRHGDDFCLIAFGSMVEPGLEACEMLVNEGYSGTVVNARFARPLDAELLKNLGERFEHIFCAEEGVVDCGFGTAVENVMGRAVVKLGLPSAFVPHGKRDFLLEKYGLDAEGIYKKILHPLSV